MKRQMLGIVAGVYALFMASGLIAGEEALLKWDTDAASLQKKLSGKIKYEDVDGKLCGVIDNRKYIISKKMIPVKVGNKYILSGMFKSLGEAPSRVYYGFICFDKNKKRIVTYHSNIIPGSATMLAQECKKGDKILVIKANKKWNKNYIVAFNVKDDFSDLPNREILFRIAKVVKDGENLKLEMSKPVKKAYPVGTKVRAHTSACGSYIYTTLVGRPVPKAWKTYSGVASIGKAGQMGWKFLRPGTAFVKIIILPNYFKKKDEKLAFKDLSLKIVE